MTDEEASAVLSAARDAVDGKLSKKEAPKSARRFAAMGICALADELGLPEESLKQFALEAIGESLLSSGPEHSRLGSLLDSAVRTVELGVDQHAAAGADGILDEEGGDLVADVLASATRESGDWLHFMRDMHQKLENLSRETDPRTLIEGLERARDGVEDWLKFVSK